MKVSDKTGFVVAFAALLVGLSSFSKEFTEIKIDLGFIDSNIRDLGIMMFIPLFLSILLYATDSIRYGISFLENKKFFKYIQYIAGFFYTLAVTFPWLVFIFWLIVLLIKNLPFVNIRNYVGTISTVIALVSQIVSIILFLFQIRKKEKIIYEKINEKASIILMETNKLIKNKEWRLSIIETFRLLEIMFKDKVQELGIDINRIPFTRLVYIFLDKGFITKTQAAKLGQLRELRNLAVHSDKEISKDQALYAIDIVNDVSKTLSSNFFTGRFFEDKVLSALKNIYVRHHIYTQFTIGSKKVDFMAEGPNHVYYIEAKMVVSPILIRQALEQLKSILKETDRGILIIPSNTKKETINDYRIKIGYFDIENEKFLNQDEIYNWVYNKNK